MATAFLAIVPKADAQVVSNDLDPDVVLINDDLDIDFDNDGVVDLNIEHSHSASSGSSFSFSEGLALVTIPTGQLLGSTVNSWIYPTVLASGAPIAPGDPNFQSGNSVATLAGLSNFSGSTSNYGNWNGQSGFLGCRFTAGDGQVHYGWVQLSVADGLTNVTIMAYGYESTPETAINAGDVGMTTGIAAANARTFNMDVTPNPTSDNAVISFPNTGSGNMRMSLLNGIGETLLNEQLGNADSYTLDLAGYAPGIYFVRLQDEKKVAFRKVVKQ